MLMPPADGRQGGKLPTDGVRVRSLSRAPSPGLAGSKRPHFCSLEHAMRRNGFRRGALVGLAVGSMVLSCLPVLAACGDGVVDGTEQCDDGSANGTDGCCSPSCTLVDRDFDGLCDALDSCDLGNGLRIEETKLVARRLLSPPGDDTLRFSGTITVPARPAID